MSLDEALQPFDHFFSPSYLEQVFKDRLQEAKFSGLDGISASAFEASLDSELDIISRKVLNGTYRFTRYKEKLILKSALKTPRQISVPTIRDALTVRALCDYLTQKFPDRRMRPPHDCTKRVYLATRRAAASDFFLRMDVQNFYPSINHTVLMEVLGRRIMSSPATSLIEKAISNPTGFDQHSCLPVGVPQGLSISNILSMIYMTDFDREFEARYQYFRYVDDILVLCKEVDVYKIHDELSGYLSSHLKLSSHPLEKAPSSKTMIAPITKGTEYLGYHVSSGELKIRKASYKKMFQAIAGCLRTLRGSATVEQVLWRLNLIITGCRFENRSVGWVFFFRQATAMSQFHRMDVFVKQQLCHYGLEDRIPSVRSFVKTYRESRYNRDKTSYIPDFDHYTLADKINTVSLLVGTPADKLAQLERAEIDRRYWAIVKRQVAKLERETIDFGTSGGS
ncbi:RNA-directed DNA polymerase [Leisingera sp. McT4-56]|uniref:RNA-directed DNA polymerase n=1 Tax=Leisingera sp. McT4-56 TaxID=2881255 RepID=UPI001CF8ED70|nr:RNA-directed DNA polymerase [Leisingera sp. McT4-56]MCB4458540.1 RNA-directed DNA polymerase [Leisingera sp. McT4-56]